MATPLLWEELTWEQITDLRQSGINMVILPIGATEQHALHYQSEWTLFQQLRWHTASLPKLEFQSYLPYLTVVPWGILNSGQEPFPSAQKRCRR